MKKILSNKLIAAILTFVFMTCISQAFAERGHGKKGNPARRLAKKLILNDSQTESVSSIFKSAQEACRDIDSQKLQKECRKEQRAVANEKINALLSDEQKIKFAAMQEKRRQRMAERKAKKQSRSEQSPSLRKLTSFFIFYAKAVFELY